MTRFLQATVLLAGLSAAGCGGSVSDLSGTVTYNGKPVVYGTVVVIGADGVSRNGPITPEGKYVVTGIASGPVKVMVSSPPPPGAKGGPKKKGGRDAEPDDERGPAPNESVSPAVLAGWVKLPDKYSLPESTDLTFTLKSGANVQNLDLK